MILLWIKLAPVNRPRGLTRRDDDCTRLAYYKHFCCFSKINRVSQILFYKKRNWNFYVYIERIAIIVCTQHPLSCGASCASTLFGITLELLLNPRVWIAKVIPQRECMMSEDINVLMDKNKEKPKISCSTCHWRSIKVNVTVEEWVSEGARRSRGERLYYKYTLPSRHALRLWKYKQGAEKFTTK